MDLACPRLHLITDARPGRRPLDVVTAAIGAAARLGVPERLAVQVRVEDDVTDRAAYELALATVALCRPAGVLCLVNDRLHVALAVEADGAHVGAEDLPVAAARRVLGPAAVLGATCRDPRAAAAAVADGASYLGVGPAFLTVTKSGLPAPIGPERIGEVARAAAPVPVVGIGGVTVDNAAGLVRAGATGVAVVGAVAGAEDPAEAVTRLLTALA